MSLAESVGQALRLLRAHPLRAVLTLFGLVWGAAAVIFLESWGSGVQTMMETAFERAGKNLMMAWAGRVSEDFSPAADRRYLWFTVEDVEALRERAHWPLLVAGETRQHLPVTFRQRAMNLETRGVEPDGIEIRGARADAGRLIRPADVDHRRRVVVLGSRSRERLLGAEGGVGDWVRIDGTPFQVVGVLERVGTQLSRDGEELDDQAWIPISVHLALWPNPWTQDQRVDRVIVRMRSRKHVERTKLEVRAILAERLGVAPTDDEAVVIFSPVEMLRNIPVDQQNAINLLIASTTILVGGVGILSMMLDSVRERRSEIGIRLAVGARRRDVMLQFLTETLCLVALGGVLGVALGVGGSLVLASPVLRSGFPAALADLIPVPELSALVVLNSVLILSAVGLLAGLVPAWRAARTDPAVTLRAD